MIGQSHMKRQAKWGYYLTLIVLLTAGCSYPLRITNEKDFIAAQPQIKPLKTVTIGFLPIEETIFKEKLLNSVVEEIGRSSIVDAVKKDYQIGSGVKADYVCALSQTMKFSASGQNFLITFPGFLVFTHAMVGYKYYIDITTKSNLLDPTNGNIISEASIITSYEIRYTSFARGAASSLIGWLAPGWGLLDVFTGMVFATDYDQRATQDFIQRAEFTYKTFVSRKIIEQITKYQKIALSNHKQQIFVMEPVVIDVVAESK